MYHSNPAHRQDRWVIEDVLHGKRGGFFVEAGAGGHSNTEALETDFGWNGLGVEPHPERFAEVRAKRACHLENVCLTDKPTEVPFLLNHEAPGTSGIADTLSDSLKKLAYHERTTYQTIMLPGIPLADLLRKHNAPKEIDYLSLDVEGAEWLILKDFPFDEFSFTCMTIERGSADYPKLRKLLLEKGYRMVRYGRADDFWVHPRSGYRAPLKDLAHALIRRTAKAAKDQVRRVRDSAAPAIRTTQEPAPTDVAAAP